MYPSVTVQPRAAVNAAFKHPWIFSRAILHADEDVVHGSLVHVRDPEGNTVGVGTASTVSSIAIRLFVFEEAVIDQAWFVQRLREADVRRHLLGYGPGMDTTGYRIVFGESDGIPGLIVDRYEDVLVFQLGTAGLDAIRLEIIEALKEVFHPRVIVERSDLPSRHEENLEDVMGVQSGDDPGLVAFQENGLIFEADVLGGQKTGFFLDQKDLRQAIRSFANGRDVLNLFSYTGSAGVAALAGGAKRVLNVDASASALEACQPLARLNKLPVKRMETQKADIFPWIASQREPAYDLVLVDPPALIKSQKDIEEGKKAYHFLNRSAMRLVSDNGIFITSSCSHYLSEEDFTFILRRASVQAGVHLSILRVIRQSPDHPFSLYFPEAGYLKSFVCEVRREARKEV
ncbi:MAG TPA: class I SAM-dependent rRNA methyltransferase [Patescibacteria group bacterium]|nr:class I SAM-dependent rRNA methyltransferase [Patescibacteria group bacterium]